MKIALIGAGNLATNLGNALFESGYSICQVYSRTQQAADTLAHRIGCQGTSSIEDIIMDADVYIVALKDSALEEVLPHLLKGREEALWVHTAGSISMSIWQNYGLKHYGVFYPMQTFSKTRQVDFNQIPIFLEASDEKELETLKRMALSISPKFFESDSEQRRILHLAAVFACNFTNAMYVASAQLLEAHGLSFEAMLPLIDETVRKVHSLHPIEAQTGPAVRYDRNVMEKHLAMLQDSPLYQELYDLTSRIIHQTATQHQLSHEL